MKKLLSVLIVVITLACQSVYAQRFSIGTNTVDILSLGTMNIEAGVAVAQKWSIHAGAEFNPWTWAPGSQEKQFQARQMSFWGGARWWPWYVYSGWWVGADGRYSIYNEGGVFSRATEEGKAYGGGIYGGYSIMLSEHWNLDMGVGAWGGWKEYTSYSCPLCGVITDEGGKVFVVPDARVTFLLIF